MNTLESKKVSETPIDSANKREFLQKYTLEKAAHEKRTKYIEQQKKVFVRQHSKDENEVKQILQRLQIEQHLLDGETQEPEPVANQVDDEDDKNDETEEVFVNPYPVTIVPKFSATSGKGDTPGGRMGRRKSLEYEDLDKVGIKGVAQSRHPSSTGRQTSGRKFSTGSEPPDELDIWVGNPEYISSVRRPRKSTSDVNHHKMLKRAGSDVWSRPNSSKGDSTPALSVYKNPTSDTSPDQKDELSVLKHNRKGSLKERKSSTNEPIYETEGLCKQQQMKGIFKRGRSVSDPQEMEKDFGTAYTRTRKVGIADMYASLDAGTHETLHKKSSLPGMKLGSNGEKNKTEKPNSSTRRRSLTERSERTMRDVAKPRTKHGSLKVKSSQSTKQDRNCDNSNEQVVSNSKITCFVEGDPVAKVITLTQDTKQ